MDQKPLTVFGIFIVAFGSLILILWFIYRYNGRPNGKASYHAQLIAARINLTQLDVPTEATDGEFKGLIRQDWEQHLQERTKARLKLENDPDSGKSVWLSIFAKRGHLRHWAILTHEHQYELRRRRLPLPTNLDVPPDSHHRAGLGTEPPPKRRRTSWRNRLVEEILGLNGSWEANGERIHDIRNDAGFGVHYKSEIKRHNSFHRFIAEREKALEAGHSPEVRHRDYGNLFILHIGWTFKTKEEVDAACERVGMSFGRYNVLFRNCQHFVREFATEIVSRQGQDWNWFMGLPLIPYQYQRPEKIRPPAGAVRLALEKLKRKAIQEEDAIWQAVAREQLEQLGRYLDELQPEFDRMKEKVAVIPQNDIERDADSDEAKGFRGLNGNTGGGWCGGGDGGYGDGGIGHGYGGDGGDGEGGSGDGCGGDGGC